MRLIDADNLPYRKTMGGEFGSGYLLKKDINNAPTIADYDTAEMIIEELKQYFTIERMGLFNHAYINDVLYEIEQKYKKGVTK